MKMIVKNLIEFSGISEPPLLSPISVFKSILYNTTLDLSVECRTIHRLLKVSAKPSVVQLSIHNTIPYASLEGSVLSEKSLIIQGEIQFILELLTDSSAAVKVSEYKCPICSVLSLPQDIRDVSDINVDIYIEDLSVRAYHRNKVFLTASILFSIC